MELKEKSGVFVTQVSALLPQGLFNCRDIERMLTHHQFATALLLFGVASSVKAGDCFVPDTTWDADTNQGFFNVTSKVTLYFQPIANGTNETNRTSGRRIVKGSAKNPCLVKDSRTSMTAPPPTPTSAKPSPRYTQISRAPTAWVDPPPAYAQVHISKEDRENSNQLNA